MKKLVCILLIFLHLNLFSQTDTLKLKLNISLGGNYTGGNFSLYRINSRNSISLENKKNEFNFSPNFQYSQIATDGVNFKLREREILYSLSYTKRWENIRMIFYNESESSFLRKINFRTSAGLGPGFKIIQNKSIELDFSELILPEFLASNFGSDFDNFAIRLSSRLKFAFKSKNFSISSITLFQPSIFTLKSGDIVVKPKDNINLRSVNNIEYSPLSWFSFGIGNEVVFQTYSISINPDLKPVDYNFSIFFRFKN